MTYWDALARAAGGGIEPPALPPQLLFDGDDGAPAFDPFDQVDHHAHGQPAIKPPPGPAISPEAEARPTRAPAGEGGPPAHTQRVVPQTGEVETLDGQEPRLATQIVDGASPSGTHPLPVTETRTIERLITERYETRTLLAEATPKPDPSPPHETSGHPSVAQDSHELVPLRDVQSPAGQDPDVGGATVVVAETIVPPERQDPSIPATDVAPFVIEIGRIDIRIESEIPHAPAVAARALSRTSLVPSLDDYLARRSEGAP